MKHFGLTVASVQSPSLQQSRHSAHPTRQPAELRHTQDHGTPGCESAQGSRHGGRSFACLFPRFLVFPDQFNLTKRLDRVNRSRTEFASLRPRQQLSVVSYPQGSSPIAPNAEDQQTIENRELCSDSKVRWECRASVRVTRHAQRFEIGPCFGPLIDRRGRLRSPTRPARTAGSCAKLIRYHQSTASLPQSRHGRSSYQTCSR